MKLPVRWQWKLDRFREQVREFFANKEEAPRPKLCPACGKLVGATQSRCHECGASTRFSLAAVSKSLSGLLPQSSPATYAILGLSCFLYFMSLMGTMSLVGGIPATGGGFLSELFGFGAIDHDILGRLGESAPLAINLQQPWRFITAIFLHGNLLHIFFNMWVLMDLGPTVEELYGSARFLFVYVVTGIGGFVLSSSIGIHLSVGGSGALLGLIGVLLAMSWGRRSMQDMRDRLIRWLIYIAILGWRFPGTDNLAHIGGALVGLLLGKIMAPNPPLNPSDRKRANLMGWGAGLAILASFALVVLTYHRPM